MSTMASQIASNSTVYSTIVETDIKEIINVRVTGHLWGEYTGDRRRISLTKGRLCGAIIIFPYLLRLRFWHEYGVPIE